MSATRECRNCNGTGEVDVIDESGPSRDTCRACGGTGRQHE